MPKSPVEIHSLLTQSLPDGFLVDSVKLLARSYELAHEQCLAFDAPEVRDSFMQIRRAIFQGQWRALAKKYPSLSATATPNKKRTAYHTRVEASGVVLTESAVNNRFKLPRQAVFRATYSAAKQLTMWSKESGKGTGPLHAVLVHGPGSGGRLLHPHFAFLGFPTEDYSEYGYCLDLGHLLESALEKTAPVVDDVQKLPLDIGGDSEEPVPLNLRRNSKKEEE